MLTRDRDRAAPPKPRALARGPPLLQQGPGRERQRHNLGAAVMRQPEGRGASGSMIAALALGLDDQGAPLVRDRSREARAGNPAADDDDVKFVHFRRWLRIG